MTDSISNKLQGQKPLLGGIGDVNSDAKGSGARYNSGKVPMELVPLTLIALSWREADDAVMAMAMRALGRYQETADVRHLLNAVDALGCPWGVCARVFEYGKHKYAEWNWAKGMAWSIPLACAARHLMAMQRREVLDDESKQPHSGHVLCNIVMLLTYAHSYPEGNDLPVGKLVTL